MYLFYLKVLIINYFKLINIYTIYLEDMLHQTCLEQNYLSLLYLYN